MAFPQTRHTLIQRIAAGAGERDWQEFLGDYWGPVSRFAQFRGQLTPEDAEDVASQTFEALIRNRLLARWASQPSAKLRTLLCSVASNILANQARVRQGRARLGQRGNVPVVPSSEPPAAEVDAFYAAWVEEVTHQAVESLLADYSRVGKGDYFRVLYGRVCEEMAIPEIARALGLTITTAENYYKHSRQRLGQKLEDLVRAHVQRYCPEEEAAAEFTAEWGHLGDYLKDHGGLEQILRQVYEESDQLQAQRTRSTSLHLARQRLRKMLSDPGERDAPQA